MDDTRDEDRNRPAGEQSVDERAESRASPSSGGTVLSRRGVLGGVVAFGGAGALTVAGTRAFWADSEESPNALGGGGLDLGLAWRTVYDPVDGQPNLVAQAGDCEEGTFVDDSDPAITLSEIRPGDSGVTEICLRTTGGPAWLWLGATCPTGGLEDVLDATVVFDADCDRPLSPDPVRLDSDGTSTTEVTGSLFEVLSTLGGGVGLGETCVSPGTHCLRFAWEFPRPGPDDNYKQYEGARTEFVLDLQAAQCRHNATPTNPFDGQCDT